jgi:hypothetical protein
MQFTTKDGGSVEITRIAGMHDVHVRNSAGESIATVRMTDPEAMTLVYEIQHGHK